MLPNKIHNLNDAADVLGVKGELILKALNYLPALRQRMNQWTVEDLTEIQSVIMTKVVARMPREGRP